MFQIGDLALINLETYESTFEECGYDYPLYLRITLIEPPTISEEALIHGFLCDGNRNALDDGYDSEPIAAVVYPSELVSTKTKTEKSSGFKKFQRAINAN